MRKGKGLRHTDPQLQNSHGDAKDSPGNIVDNIVITLQGARQVPEIPGRGEHSVKCVTV